MADRTIGSLPGVHAILSDSLFPAEQSGVASKVTGAQIADFAKAAANANIETAVQAAAEAKEAAATAAEKASEAEDIALHPPRVNPVTGYWQCWNSETGQYEDTVAKAEGPVGPPGPAGSGSGDMLSSVYDTQGKALDLYVYCDNAISAAIGAAIGGMY